MPMSDRPCEKCGTPYPELQRDHIVPKFEGGTDDSENIWYICPNCHHLKSQAERRRMGPLVAEAMARMTPEQRATWSAKISATKRSPAFREKMRAKWGAYG